MENFFVCSRPGWALWLHMSMKARACLGNLQDVCAVAEVGARKAVPAE